MHLIGNWHVFSTAMHALGARRAPFQRISTLAFHARIQLLIRMYACQAMQASVGLSALT